MVDSDWINEWFFTSESTTKRRKLELLSQYSLFGNIECLQAVRLAGSSRDSLLMSFKDAKVQYAYSAMVLFWWFRGLETGRLEVCEEQMHLKSKLYFILNLHKKGKNVVPLLTTEWEVNVSSNHSHRKWQISCLESFILYFCVPPLSTSSKLVAILTFIHAFTCLN